MIKNATEMLGYADFTVNGEQIKYNGKFKMSIYAGRTHLVADITLEAATGEALRNTIISAKNLISWAEEQLRKQADVAARNT